MGWLNVKAKKDSNPLLFRSLFPEENKTNIETKPFRRTRVMLAFGCIGRGLMVLQASFSGFECLCLPFAKPLQCSCDTSKEVNKILSLST